MSAWIEMISDEQAGPALKPMLELARTPHGTVDNVMRVHSLRPHTMEGHIVLYRAALHNDNNTLPMWLQETIAAYVSVLNECPYSYANHWANARHLMGDADKADKVEKLINETPREQPPCSDVLTEAECALLDYARKLTIRPGQMQQADVAVLREGGFSDGEILEANQVIGYFNYANRLLNGLGVTTDGDVVGYYSQDDAT